MSILGTALLAFMMQALPLQGVVIKTGTTEPLSRATVELRRDQQGAGILDSIITEDDGRFSFSNVAPGRYRLTVTRRGYTRPPLTITLAAGQRTEDIQLNMRLTGSISGRVVDASGRPLGNVEVRAMKASYPEGRRVLTPVQAAVTNDLGEYRLFWLAPGRYYAEAVHAKAQGMFRQVAIAVSVVWGGKPDPALGNISLIPESDSETIRYAPIFFGGTTDEQTASAIDLTEASDFSGVNFVVEPVQARHVRGVVIDGVTGRPAMYGSVTLPKNLDAPPMKEVQVDRETAAFDLLLFPGSHTLTATSASGEGYADFTLGGADIDLTVATTPGFDIPVRLVVEGQPISAAVLESLHMSLRREPPSEDPFDYTSYSAPLPNGSFSVSASAGDFRINIAPILNVASARSQPPPALQNAYVKSIRLGNTDVLNGPMHLDRQPSAALEVVVATNPGALNDQVVKGGAGPAADVPVLLMPENRRRNELYRTTVADASGRFHFDRIPPGDYKVFSWEEVEDGAWYDSEFMKANESRGIPVRIGEGRTETARVEVIP